MPTVIDSLVVTLGLDAKQFNEEQQKAVKHLQDLEGATKKHGGNATRSVNEMVTAFKELQGRLLAVGALVMAGLGFNRLTQDVTKAATELGNLSKTLGMSAQDLDAWEKAGRTVGATTGEMTQNLQALKAQIQEFHATGRSELQALMGQVGIKPMQPNDTPESVAKRLSEWYTGQKDKAYASHLLQSRGGLSQGMINMLGLGPEELQKRLDTAKRIAPTDDEINKFKKLTEAFGDLLNVVDRLTQKALVPFIETMTKVLNMVTEWLTNVMIKGVNPDAAKAAVEGMGSAPVPPATTSPLKRFNNWWRGRVGLPTDDSAGGGGAAAPGAAPGGAQPSSPGGVSPGGGAANGTLSEQRMRFQRELDANPELRDKVLRIAANEQGRNPEGTQSVIESMMNRALVRGTSLEQAARWYGSERGGYYERGNMGRGALENPGHRAILEQGLRNALGGSNVSNYATDNSSGSLAEREKATGTFRYRSAYGGETFFAPGSAEPGRSKAWDAWHKSVTERESGRGAPMGAATPGITGAQRTFEMWQGLGFGKGAATRGGDNNSTSNTNTSTTNIGSMNVSVPPGSDPSAYADGISRRLGDYNNVANANTGLV